MSEAHDHRHLEHVGPAEEKFTEMVGLLRSSDATRMTHDELESYVVREGRELQRRLLQLHLECRVAEERRVRVLDAGGQLRTSTRRGSLKLPPEVYSLGVRRRVAEEIASGSFDHTVDRLAATTGAAVPKRQVEELARRAATDFEAFYGSRTAVPAEDPRTLLILTFDAAGIVVGTEDLRKQAKRAARKQAEDPRWPPKRLGTGQKRNRKRMVQVAAVYDTAPFVRASADVVRDLRPVASQPAPRRPKPVNKTVRVSVLREAREVVREAFDEADHRDPAHRRRWVVLVDGHGGQLELVRAEARKRGVDVTIVIDLIHVLEYLWKAAYCFHAAGTPEAEFWVMRRLGVLLDGTDASLVAAGMRRSAGHKDVASRNAVSKCAGYLSKYRAFLRYGEAIANGLPVATGVVEGACRHLVRDRMSKTGARWSVAGAEAVLQLRAIRANGDFEGTGSITSTPSINGPT